MILVSVEMGLDLGAVLLAGTKYAAIGTACATLALALFGYYMIDMVCSWYGNPGSFLLENQRIGSDSSILRRRGSFEQGSDIDINFDYINEDGPNDFYRVGVSNLNRYHYFEEDTGLLFAPDSSWTYTYCYDISRTKNVDLNYTLLDVSRNENIRVVMYRGQLGGIDNRFGQSFLIGPVTESTLTDFMANTERVCSDDDDWDGDGLTVKEEYEIMTSDKLIDTDHDQISDYNEINVYHTNPLLGDTDHDLLGDGQEIGLVGDIVVSNEIHSHTGLLQHTLDCEKEDIVRIRKITGLDWDGNHRTLVAGTDYTFADDKVTFANFVVGIDTNFSVTYSYLYSTSDPLLHDTDGDFLSDGIELFDFHSDPEIVDTDKDGLSDLMERYIETDPCATDTDNDGLGDHLEVSLGFDPKSSDSPGTTTVQSELLNSENLGYYAGQETFGMYSENADPWNSLGYDLYYGDLQESMIVSSEIDSLDIEHKDVYQLTGSKRGYKIDQNMDMDWTYETWMKFTGNSTDTGYFNTELCLGSGKNYTLRYSSIDNEWLVKLDYSPLSWQVIATDVIYTEDIWMVVQVDWDYSEEELTFNIDDNADQTFDITQTFYSASETSLASRDNDVITHIMFESSWGVEFGKPLSLWIDSPSLWNEIELDYKIGDLYDLVEVPEIFMDFSSTSLEFIYLGWANSTNHDVGLYYSDESFILNDVSSVEDIINNPSLPIKFELFSGGYGTVIIPSEGDWYFAPFTIFKNHWMQPTEVICEDFTKNVATIDFSDDTLYEMPGGWTGSTTNEVTDTMQSEELLYQTSLGNVYSFRFDDAQSIASVTGTVSNEYYEFNMCDYQIIDSPADPDDLYDSIFFHSTTMPDDNTEFYVTYDFKLPAVRVDEAQSLIQWYTRNPLTSKYNVLSLTDDSDIKDVYAEKSISLTDIKEEAIEFRLHTNESNKQFRVYLKEGTIERISFKIHNDGYYWLSSGPFNYNTSIPVIQGAFALFRIEINCIDNFAYLYLGDEYIDAFEIDQFHALDKFGIATDIEDADYTVMLDSIGFSWQGYEPFEQMGGIDYSLQEFDFDGPRSIGMQTAAYIGTSSALPASVEVVGTTAFYSDWAAPDEFLLYDISNPEVPTYLSSIAGTYDLAYKDGFVYTISDNAIMIYDISDPSDPELIGSSGEWYHNQYPGGQEIELYEHVDVDSGEKLVAIVRDGTTFKYIDVTDPTIPAPYVDSEFLVGLFSIPIDSLTGTEGMECMDIIGNSLVVVATDTYGQGVYTFDLSYPMGHPSWITPNLLDYLDIGSWCLEVQGDYVYIGTVTGLSVYDYSDPKNPTLTDELNDYPGTTVVALDGFEVYIMTMDTLACIDITDPYNLVEHSKFETTPPYYSDMAMAGSTIILAEHYTTGAFRTIRTSYEFEGIDGWTYTDGIYMQNNYNGMDKVIELRDTSDISSEKLSTEFAAAEKCTFEFLIASSDVRYPTTVIFGDTYSDAFKFSIVDEDIRYFDYAEGKWMNLTYSIPYADGIGSQSISGNLSAMYNAFYNIEVWFNCEDETKSVMLFLNDEYCGEFLLPTNIEYIQEVIFSTDDTAQYYSMYIDSLHYSIKDSDTDSDGIYDMEELVEGIDNYKTDPFSADTDGDSLIDGWEYMYVPILNPTIGDLMDPNNIAGSSGDFDSDKVTNIMEQSIGTNPIVSTFGDADNLPDDWERYYGLDPFDGTGNNGDDGDFDYDTLTNIFEYNNGLNPNNPGDNDLDGMADGWEVCYGFDPNNAADANLDYDFDMVTNLQEYSQGTNPLILASDDGDFMFDDWEQYYGLDRYSSLDAGTDPNDPINDLDGDHAFNIDEFNNFALYDTKPNRFSIEGDTDNLPRDWEICYGLDPNTDGIPFGNEHDPDGDLVVNEQEWLHFTHPNSNQDNDDSGLGDGMDDDWEIRYDLDPTTSADANIDSDGDKVTNLEEFSASSLIHQLNPTQLALYDTDGDLMWDDWEFCHNLNLNDPNDADTDLDGDKVSNYDEFIQGTNPTTALDVEENNGLGDGLFDDWENYYGDTSLFFSGNDEDGDGLDDEEEFAWGTWGSNPTIADTDNDGMDDAYEVYYYNGGYGLNPIVPDAGGQIDNDYLTNIQEHNLTRAE